MTNQTGNRLRTILLVGNPNSGKSSVFSRLTGAEIISANYPGSTVGLRKSTLTTPFEKFEIIDTPGLYSLDTQSTAERVTVKVLEEADLIINVIESTNLERNLHLTLQMLALGKPSILVLNFWDETKHTGVEIDADLLKKKLGVPVIATCAVTGEGISDLVATLPKATPASFKINRNDLWTDIGDIIDSVQTVYHKHHSLRDRLADLTIKPATGLPFAAVMLSVVFIIIRIIGESLISYILDPLFKSEYMPFLIRITSPLHDGFLRDLLLGKTGEAMTSFGILTTGIYVPFVSVLPYIFAFYLALSILEDTGYLPRFAVLLDNIFHRFGMHGFSAIPIVLGFGCKVPSLLSLRILASEREKVLAAILILMAAPCMPQTAMIFSVGSRYGPVVVLTIFAVLVPVSVVTSFFLNKILKGEAPEIFLEIPPYRFPLVHIILRKLWTRIREFLFEAVPMIIFGVLVINILDIFGFIHLISETLGKLTSAVMGVPVETGVVMILGFLRKDMSISMLAPLNLTAKQFIIAATFMVLYLPCFATFFTLIKELGLSVALKICGLVFLISVVVCTLLNLIIR